MVKNNFGKRGTDTQEPVPVIAVEPELTGEEPEAANSIVSLVLVGLLAASAGVGGIFAWSQKDTIVAQVDDWKRTAIQWQAGPSDKKKFAYKNDSYGSFSALGAGARIARLAMIDYGTSRLQDPKKLASDPRGFVKSYNYDVFVKATKLFALADACKDKTATAVAVVMIRVSTGRNLQNIGKLQRMLKRGDSAAVTSTEKDCKKRVPSMVNEILGMV